jgi:hypothetical protein
VRFIIVILEGRTAFDSINASINIFPMFPVPINPMFTDSFPPSKAFSSKHYEDIMEFMTLLQNSKECTI